MKKLLTLIFVTLISYSAFATSKPAPITNTAPALPDKETATQSTSKTDSTGTSHTKQKDISQKSKKIDETAAYRKAIDDFKTFILKTKPKVREEVNEYRASIEKLKKQEIELYKRLTLEAQEFLAKEAKFKKALLIETPTTTGKSDTSKK